MEPSGRYDHLSEWNVRNVIQISNCYYNIGRLFYINDDVLEISNPCKILYIYIQTKNIFKSMFLQIFHYLSMMPIISRYNYQ